MAASLRSSATLPSLIYDSGAEGMALGTVAFGMDNFKVLLVTAAYTPDKVAHTRRSDITGEVTGTGYTAGGAAVTIVIDATAADVTGIELGGATWPLSTISAAGAVYYDARGGDPVDDDLVCYVDFSGTVSSLAGMFSLQQSTIQLHNP
jgi:hypothetical protein